MTTRTPAASPAAIAGGRGLDWFNLFVANVQTGFGPFVAVYLTSEAWTQREIGTALSIGTLATIASQLPAGALVDALTRKRIAAFLGCIAIAVAALILAFFPNQLSVGLAEILHGFASCMLGPAIVAMSLTLVGRSGLGERLGRNARYSAIGSGGAAAIMGLCGKYVSEAAVFYLTAALILPSLLALWRVRMPPRAEPPKRATKAKTDWREIRALFTDHRLLVFSLCILLFQMANAALLPLVAGESTKHSGSSASLIIAACIVVPQVLVAILSPAVGHAADRFGRRSLLLVCFATLTLRALLLSVVNSPVLLVAVQALDGITAAGLGVLIPLIAADLTRGTNRLNLCIGALGLTAALGATLSTTLAGAVADRYGIQSAILGLALCGLTTVVTVAVAMPETRDARS